MQQRLGGHLPRRSLRSAERYIAVTNEPGRLSIYPNPLLAVAEMKSKT